MQTRKLSAVDLKRPSLTSGPIQSRTPPGMLKLSMFKLLNSFFHIQLLSLAGWKEVVSLNQMPSIRVMSPWFAELYQVRTRQAQTGVKTTAHWLSFLRSSTKLNDQVSISPTFYAQLFCTKLFYEASLYLHILQFGFAIICRQNIGTKAAHKFLV